MRPNNQVVDSILSEAKRNFEQSKREIQDLLKIHAKMEGEQSGQAGRRPDRLQVLHRAAIIMITACWEAYLEILFREAFKYLLDHSNNPQEMPSVMIKYACNKIKENKDTSFVWKFAGNNWKDMLKQYANEKLDKFNTPSTAKINDLFKYLGLIQLSNCWKWQNMNDQKAVSKLDYYINIRHEIAHGQRSDDLQLNKTHVEDYLNHVERLIDETEKEVKKYVEKQINEKETASGMERPEKASGEHMDAT